MSEEEIEALAVFEGVPVEHCVGLALMDKEGVTDKGAVPLIVALTVLETEREAVRLPETLAVLVGEALPETVGLNDAVEQGVGEAQGVALIEVICVRLPLADKDLVSEGEAVRLTVALAVLVGEALPLIEGLNDAVAQSVGEAQGLAVVDVLCVRQLLADRDWVTEGDAERLTVALAVLVGEALPKTEGLNDAVEQGVGEAQGVALIEVLCVRLPLADRDWVTEGEAVRLTVALAMVVSEALLQAE